MIFLLIETSSPVCSVAIANKNGIVAIKEENSGLKHAALAPLFVQEMMRNYKPDAVVISAGPGSYTGLRIGTSLAKGICYGQNIPLIAASTLQAMTDGLPNKSSFTPDTVFMPMLDARRMEVYTAAYDTKGKTIMPVNPIILNKKSFEQLTEKPLVCFGSGSEKSKPLFATNKNIRFIDNFQLSARYLLTQAIEKYNCHQFENLSYFEPQYLKDFKVTTSKKKLF